MGFHFFLLPIYVHVPILKYTLTVLEKEGYILIHSISFSFFFIYFFLIISEIGIGVGINKFPLARAMPGWLSGSLGYHGDDGNFYQGTGHGSSFGPTFATGDVLPTPFLCFS